MEYRSGRSPRNAVKIPLLFITENGSSFHEPQDISAVNDIKRQSFIKNHLLAVSVAIQSKVLRLSGYFVWSLMDNFEWQFGYQRGFGIIRVDYDTLARRFRYALS